MNDIKLKVLEDLQKNMNGRYLARLRSHQKPSQPPPAQPSSNEKK
jgi:hypothetical protein